MLYCIGRTAHFVLPRMREWIEIPFRLRPQHNRPVLPRMREWIEIDSRSCGNGQRAVLPRMREWIEILSALTVLLLRTSSPSYEGVD